MTPYSIPFFFVFKTIQYLVVVLYLKHSFEMLIEIFCCIKNFSTFDLFVIKQSCQVMNNNFFDYWVNT